MHIRDSGVFDEKGWWFTAVRDNRAVRFVASADALVPRGIGLDVDIVIDPWNSKWPTKMLNEEELSRVDARRLVLSSPQLQPGCPGGVRASQVHFQRFLSRTRSVFSSRYHMREQDVFHLR